MVIQTKLVDTKSLNDLYKQFVDVRRDDLPENLEKSLKSWVKKLDDEKDPEKHKSCFKSMCIGLFTHLIENKNVDLTILEVSYISFCNSLISSQIFRSFISALKNHRRRG